MLCCVLLLIWFSADVSTSSNIGATRNDITLSKDGGYSLLIAIDDREGENLDIIDMLQTSFTRASYFLLTATKNQMYFKDLTILVPPDWRRNSTWQLATKDETFDKARVLIAPANLAWGDEPYTLQPGQCVEEGDYIHFTSSYLINQSVNSRAKPAKRIVREFAHLKWGLFDEGPLITDPHSQKYYLQDGSIHATKCSKSGIFGTWDDSNDANCKLGNCQFVPRRSSAKASLLYADYLESIVDFCSPDTHNELATNRQNTFCKGQSAWQVLNSSPDFKANYSIARYGAQPPAPRFRIVQRIGSSTVSTSAPESSTTTSESRTVSPTNSDVKLAVSEKKEIIFCRQDVVCLALDVSGSMITDNRIGKMATSVSNYLKFTVRDNSAVGIVAFSTYAHLKASIARITNPTIRASLLSAVPQTASGGTSIGAGLESCKNMLTSYTGDQDSSKRIFLLSDGKENERPFVSSILPSVKVLQIPVDTVTFSQQADTVLAKISEETGGKKYYAPDSGAIKNLNEALLETTQRGCSKKSTVALVESKNVNIPPGASSVTRYVQIDNTIGKNTTLTFTYKDDITVKVRTKDNNTVTISKDEALKTITVAIEGQVNGAIEYTITKTVPSFTESVVVSVTSKPRPGAEPITVKVVVNDDNIKFTKKTMLVCYVHIFQGLNPVLNLNVSGILKTPSSGTKYFTLQDKGTGKDSTLNDGVYTGTFFSHEFTDSGRYYNLQVEVSGEGVLPNSSHVSNRTKRSIATSLGHITRITAGELITVNNWKKVYDTTPPEKIKDLRSVDISTNGSVFRLSWTAPGDDLNLGTVVSYEMMVATNESFSDAVKVPAKALHDDLNTLLVKAGTSLELLINVKQINPSLFGLNETAQVSTYYFKMRTSDDEGNVAEWSNPVSASYVDPATLLAFFTTTTEQDTTVTSTMAPTTTEIITTTATLSTTAAITTSASISTVPTTPAMLYGELAQEQKRYIILFSLVTVLLIILALVCIAVNSTRCRARRHGQYSPAKREASDPLLQLTTTV